MFAIAKHELMTLLRSPAAIVIILLFAGGSIGQVIAEQALGSPRPSDPAAAYASTSLIISLFGYFFVSGLCHDCLNREIKDKTIRLLVSKTSRASVVWGKYVGMGAFWLICLVVAFAITSVLEGVFGFDVLARFAIYMLFYLALVELLSVLIPNTRATSFIGVVLGLIFAIAPAAIPADGPLAPLAFLMPSHWGDSFPQVFVLLAAAIVFMAITHILIARRDF